MPVYILRNFCAKIRACHHVLCCLCYCIVEKRVLFTISGLSSRRRCIPRDLLIPHCWELFIFSALDESTVILLSQNLNEPLHWFTESYFSSNQYAVTCIIKCVYMLFWNYQTIWAGLLWCYSKFLLKGAPELV